MERTQFAISWVKRIWRLIFEGTTHTRINVVVFLLLVWWVSSPNFQDVFLVCVSKWFFSKRTLESTRNQETFLKRNPRWKMKIVHFSPGSGQVVVFSRTFVFLELWWRWRYNLWIWPAYSFEMYRLDGSTLPTPKKKHHWGQHMDETFGKL